MKSTPLIFQDFSIAGLRKQWEWQQLIAEFKAGVSISTVYQKSMETSPVQTLKKGDNVYTTIGCKTETRRTRGLDKINENPYRWQFEAVTDIDYVFTNTKTYDKVLIKCPYGKIGDEIWVKETFFSGLKMDADGYFMRDEEDNLVKGIWYKADGEFQYYNDEANRQENIPWKSPLFMPKAASRIKLEITGISIQRLQDITQEGAIREGVEFPIGHRCEYWENPLHQIRDCYRCVFKNTWVKLHKDESWDKNPFVWVIQFTVKEFKL